MTPAEQIRKDERERMATEARWAARHPATTQTPGVVDAGPTTATQNTEKKP